MRTHPSNDSRHERGVTTKAIRESGFGHADARERGRILEDIEVAANQRTLFLTEVHEILGLAPGSLEHGTLTTERLREAREGLNALPNVQFNLTGKHRGVPLMTLDMVIP
ncbi:hypothetical protein [Lichenibacterium ramalinae]|uniref:Uncharacterized protein n=1 Tax=Lichenibacterium ramalinae TaxID=2316527 RepID=A0A4Q2RAY0_9HYPH|nr:hypothetical protein [Lichenibacterium ramalinae]RYB03570.1 hypothetical protein D3272_15560 [Lichenibacterium ramalinae]